MRTIYVFSFLLLVLVASTQAQDSLKVQPYPITEGEELHEIDVRELPEVVKEKITSEDYSSWILQAAWRVPSGSEGQLVPSDDYIVELRRNDDEITRIRFDSEGNRLSEPFRDE